MIGGKDQFEDEHLAHGVEVAREIARLALDKGSW